MNLLLLLLLLLLVAVLGQGSGLDIDSLVISGDEKSGFHGVRNGLEDIPIVTDRSDEVLYLDGLDWTFFCSDSDHSKCHEQVRGKRYETGKVPGDLISDLERAEVIGDPLYELNFKTDAVYWNYGNWTYLKEVRVDQDLDHFLVFDGIKMGAVIRVDGIAKEYATDQFLRYIIPLPKGGDQQSIVVSVSFERNIEEDGRFMACSGGWDWAPFTGTQKHDALTMTFGIWKSVYIVPSENGVALIHASPQILPTKRFDETHGKILPWCDITTSSSEEECFRDWVFEVYVRAHFISLRPVVVNCTVFVDWEEESGQETSVFVSPDMPMATETLYPHSKMVNISNVRLWWPHSSPRFKKNNRLHEMKVCIRREGKNCMRKRVGFRDVALVTGDDTDPEYVKDSMNKEGNSNHGMYFRLNGEISHARGGNVIPMDEMEARYDSMAHRQLVQNAVDGNFNFVRIWGGGVFLPHVFYEACDELGLLVFHDMMYAQRGHSPKRTKVQAAELKHQVRRLSHHPSIIVWNSCNECVVIPYTPTGIYASFVIQNVVEEDISRPVWPSCPSNGWSKGVDRLSSRPLARNITLSPHVLVWHRIELHGPYLHGTGFAAINGLTKMDKFVADLPPTLDFSKNTGPAEPNTFVSEFGAVVMSSFESLAPTLHKDHYSLHGGSEPDNCNNNIYANTCKGNNTMAERNYPCDNIIEAFFGDQIDLSQVGENEFRAQLYLCMLGQALHMKSVIESKRAMNQFGIVTWQLNEIWPTGGWGSVEYGSKRPGQVVGGRWKILHHWFSEYMFKDIVFICGKKDQCFVRNDGHAPSTEPISVLVHALNLETGNLELIRQADFLTIPSFENMILDEVTFNETHHARLLSIVGKDGELLSHSTVLLDAPKHLPRTKSTLLSTKILHRNKDGTIDIELSIPKDHPPVALFVHLTTLAQGRFDTNGFIYLQDIGLSRCAALHAKPSKRCHIIQFIPFDNSDIQFDLLNSTLKVMHLQEAYETVTKL